MKGVFMKKYVSFLSLLLFMLNIYTPALAASVPAVTYTGNDADPNIYSPPNGCIHYQIPNSDTAGTHTLIIDNQGAINPDGSNLFTATIGTIPGNNYSELLSWSSNFPIYAVIISNGDVFNLYRYDTDYRGDTSLLSPEDASGLPTSISHVSIVICPDTFSTGQTSSSLDGTLLAFLIVNTVFQIISTIFLGILAFFLFLILFGSTFNIFGSCISRFHRKSRKSVKFGGHNKVIVDLNKDRCKNKDKDCEHKKKEDCSKEEDKEYNCKPPYNYCDKKHDPGDGYSLDCNNNDLFPYNKYHNYYK
jgi:hypothetical protein